jgi:hypothetical protein
MFCSGRLLTSEASLESDEAYNRTTWMIGEISAP